MSRLCRLPSGGDYQTSESSDYIAVTRTIQFDNAYLCEIPGMTIERRSFHYVANQVIESLTGGIGRDTKFLQRLILAVHPKCRVAELLGACPRFRRLLRSPASEDFGGQAKERISDAGPNGE